METLEHFHEHGWMRLPGAFSSEAAAAMREAVWGALADAGIRREHPSTWTVERPAHLQELKDHPAFREVGGRPVIAAIDAVLEGQAWETPKDWGALFIAFPSDQPWGVPSGGWHADAKYTSPLTPPRGVKTFALFGDIEPRCGGTLILGGSHRLIHDWFRDHPPPPGAKSADMRKLLLAHPYIRDLHAPGGAGDRIARFMDRVERSGDIPLRVVEGAGQAGDVILLHPLTLHVAAPNAGRQPRFMLSGGVTTDGWGWA